MPEKHHGITREEQVRDIAAHLGVADFVYAALPVRKGAALREVSGDGLLVVGNRGAALQVKARDPRKAREVRALTSLRPSQALRTGASDGTTTIGVGALVEEKGGQSAVAYSFLMFKGREAEVEMPEMPEDIRRYYEWRYGVHSHRTGETREVVVGRNEPCPCVNGKKFKRCCGQ